MTREQVVAQALVCWIGEKLGREKDIAREGLPEMDAQHFLSALARVEGFPAQDFSIALVGFGLDATTLRTLADRAGLNGLAEISDNLNSAAAWRNKRRTHKRILALARGRHPGVHTLKHFAPPHSRELARSILEWAALNRDLSSTGAQQKLLEALAKSPQLEPLRSIDLVAGFLATWARERQNDPNDAPRRALPALGLLADPGLFSDLDRLEERLVRNHETVGQLIDMPPQLLRQRRKQIERYQNVALRDELLDILARVERLRLGSTAELRTAVTLDEALKLFRPPKDESPESPPGPEAPPEQPPEPDEELGLPGVGSQSAGCLLDDQQEQLEEVVRQLEDAWNSAAEENADQVEGEIGSGDDAHPFKFEIDREFLDWLHTFCNADAWGGLIESKEPSLELAVKLHSASNREPIKVSAAAIVVEEGQARSMLQILQEFDREVPGAGGPPLNLAPKWERFAALRGEIIPHLDFLVHFPLTWLAGKPVLAEKVDEYLCLSADIYRLVQENYRNMTGVSEGLARAVLEGLLSLDVMQVRIELDDGRIAHKAVLLPTHPLHLWRFQRLTQLLRGLGARIKKADREAILKDVMRPEQFLSVLCLGSIPEGRGADQILPVANQIHGLATFENLRNAISSVDGADELANAIERFAILARHHARPLRVAVVNPPEPTKLMARLVAVLNRKRESTLPCLRVELFCTPDHAHRLQTAMRLSSDRELLEDKVASGRLEFKVHETPRQLPELLADFEESPFHIVSIFDEATIFIRRRSRGQLLPMSPFCVRRQIRADRIRKELELEPTSDEPPFSEYMMLINEAQSGQRDSSPHAWADADGLRKTVDQLLKPDRPAAHWVFLADRALPSEGRMRAVRLLEKREGQRQVLLAAADYRRLSELIKPIFDHHNLSMSTAQLEQLLREGIGLIGSGFFDLIRSQDGGADPNRVRGLAGMLLSARDYRQRHPECLLIAVDSELARLWLRLGRRTGERCDLLAVRRDGDRFILECIEVKTTAADELTDDGPVIVRAKEQIEATLEACAAALPDNVSGQDPLSAPRCEMLKEILVRACQSRANTPDLRAKWCAWLPEMFRQEGPGANIGFTGEVVRVLLGCNDAPRETVLVSEPFKITARDLTERRIQDLIDQPAGELPQPPDGGSGGTRPPAPVPQAPTPAPTGAAVPAATATVVTRISPSPAAAFVMPPSPQPPSATPTTEGVVELPWPPQVNALKMIGQADAVAQLLNQVNFAKSSGRRFPDKLLVGPAGVGKSSLARAIARRLLNEEEILFNGADLRLPSMLIARLAESQKIPARPRGTVTVKSCLIFIDEAHGMSSAVATTLLGAMDDRRLTTIDGVNYDFEQVIIMLATTDPGRLSEAFNSRPDKTYLRSYSLHELAGIVWLQGKLNLNDFELPKEACYEIAARMRCQPRRAVRALTQSLVPHFHGQTHQPGERANYSRIGNALTKDAVVAWFEAQGIDLNGLDATARSFLAYLRRNGATSAERMQQALGITNRADFVEIDEYLVRLGLVTVSAAGRMLTREGSRYLAQPFDLRHRISRQQI